MRTLAADWILLTMHPERGRPEWACAGSLLHAVAGALLLELALAGRLELAADRLQVADPTPTGDPVLDRALSRIQAASRPRPAGYWVGRLAWSDPCVNRLQDGLVQAGVLRKEERRWLGMIPLVRYPVANPAEREAVRARLATPACARDEALLLLAHACQLIDHLVPQGYRLAARKRAETLMAASALGQAVAGAVAAAICDGVAATVGADGGGCDAGGGDC